MNTGPFFIRLQHADGRLPVCASKFWGNPDLPEDVDYPMAYYPDTDSYEPYHFICQINLADLPPQDILPRRGLLQFYANIHYYLGWDCDVEISGYPSGADMVKVLYFPDPDPASFRTVVVVGDDESDVLFPQEMAMSFDGSLRDDEPCIHLLGEPEFREDFLREGTAARDQEAGSRGNREFVDLFPGEEIGQVAREEEKAFGLL